MANILSTSQLVQKLIDFLKSAQPNLSTSPGSVARDLFVDATAIRIAELYNELSRISSAQSINQSVGDDLDNLASNYDVQKLEPGKSSGPAILTFNSLFSDITIPAGSIIYSRNGMSFKIIAGTVALSANEAQYRSLATTFRTDLDFVGLTDNYAIQVSVECASTGINGNIPKYNLSAVSIPGISGVTNNVPFTGGSSAENDGSYKTRILSVFSGSNTGTSLGYKNIIISNPSVLDAVVIVPGDPLMTRDDTVISKDSDGNPIIGTDGEPIILSEGTGGKVDISVYGRRLIENIDSWIYVDKSGKNDPTNSLNDFTIGQIAGDENKTITKRRLENISNGTLPNQPVENIVEVIGSLSGTFTPQAIDQFGNSFGNYSLLKDTGTYAGSVFGFDKIHWVRNYISTNEDVTKNVFNGQDSCSFSNVIEIDALTRIIPVLNENSKVSSLNRSEITLSHTPIRAVNKVLNYTTGERYTVSDRNPGGSTGDLNTSGKIIISGKNLPAVSDILQVDYEWEYAHDIFNDIDSFVMKDNPRTAIDVIDWGYGNAIRRENPVFIDGYTLSTTHNISSVISVNKVLKEYSKTVGLNTSTLGLIITNMSQSVINVVSVKRNSDGAELYNTKKDDGSFDGTTISLPSDTSASVLDIVDVTYNATDLYTINGLSGNFKDNIIYLSEEQAPVTISDILEANYIANINEILPATNLASLPATKNNNGFITNTSTTLIGTQPVTNICVGIFPINNLRRAPAKLGLNISGITANGVLTILGKTTKLLKDIIFKNVGSGFKLDFSSMIKQAIGINSLLALPSNIKLSRLISLEHVETSSNVVTNVLHSYDITGYALQDNFLVLDESIIDSSLSVTEATLPSTAENLLNEPLLGETLRASVYITYDNDSENISFSSNGALYTDKSFVYINKISISSGFKSANTISGSVSLFALSQPPSGSRYKLNYIYTAPKAGERITIRYNSNVLMSDLILALEEKRPITADVIVKSASSIFIDVIANITILKEYKETGYIIAQNVADKVTAFINNLTLGASLNPSDIINIAYQAQGLDSIVIQRFNKSENIGNASIVTALRNQYMQANNIQINIK